MKSDPEVIRILNDLLTNELTAINQYFIHAKLCAHWGFKKLADKIHHESIDEMKHADVVIERILFLEGVPNLQRYHKLQVGENVREALNSDLQFEYAAIKFLNESIETLRRIGDHGTEELLRKILVGEEEHTDWLETQLDLIQALGEQNYLAEKMGD
jgi:bacterioferritin